MTILTGAFIYMAGMVGFLMFFRHVRSCDENMRAEFLEALATRQDGPKGAPMIHHAI